MTRATSTDTEHCKRGVSAAVWCAETRAHRQRRQLGATRQRRVALGPIWVREYLVRPW
jgi:hypothetical protein